MRGPIPPMLFDWDGEVMRPFRPTYADRHFVVGQQYRLEVVEERSTATHNHEFAFLAEAWKQLPEALADIYPSPEHLRKRALIEGGFFDEEAVDAGNNAAALRVASFVRSRDDFAFVIVRGPIVLVRTAKSQSRRAMNKAEFQASKEAVLQIVSTMIGTTPEQLRDNAGAAA